MRKNEALVRLLCLPHCHYYKPGRNEELLCRGAVVIKRLIEAGRSLTAGSKPGPDIDREAGDQVARLVCGACEFREQDCDFAQDRKARPCGGFVLIAELLESGTIEIDDLR